MNGHGGPAPAHAHVADPPADRSIFHSFSVAAENDSLSRFGDDEWLLLPMANKTTTTRLKIDFTTLPTCYRDTGRRIVWSLVNERTPIDALMRNTAIRDRLSAGAVAGMFPLIRAFLDWLDDRGVWQLNAVTSEDLRAYASHVTTRAIGREFKSHLLFAVTRTWLIAHTCPKWTS